MLSERETDKEGKCEMRNSKTKATEGQQATKQSKKKATALKPKARKLRAKPALKASKPAKKAAKPTSIKPRKRTPTADELLLDAWSYTYANRHKRLE